MQRVFRPGAVDVSGRAEAPPSLLGAVLAGGRSRRFGRDKAAEPVGGVPLAERAAATLAEVLPEVVFVSSHGPPKGSGRPHVADLRAPCGPLGGIEAALARAAELGLDGAFVLACDLPLVDADVVRSVMATLGGARAAAPARAGTPPCEPLCAAYRVSCLAAARSLLDRGSRAAHELFTAVDGVTVEVPAGAFLNVNTPADRDRAERRLDLDRRVAHAERARSS